MRRVLFLAYRYDRPAPGDRFETLGAIFRGDVLSPTRQGTASSGATPLTFGGLTWRALPPARAAGFLRRLFEVAGFVSAGHRILRGADPPEVIIAVGLFKTAVAGLLLARLHRRRLIVEVPIVPGKIVLFRDRRRSPARRLRARLADGLARAVLQRADHVKVIYPGQLAAISPALASVPSSAFPDFTPLARIALSPAEDFLLLLGTPLFLKGADLAVRAFAALRSRFPDERLVIVGSRLGFPDLRPLIAPGDPVELVDYLPHEAAVDHIRRAKIVLLPSRTDAMPRVAVEAMAAGKPIIAARVDGIPHYLRHGVNCLLCEPDDDGDLAAKLAALLADAGLRARIGAQARRDALTWFDEGAYAARFRQMVEDCLARRPGAVFRY
jgi:glycosyltransferase involved in cell wall biosynthesis